VKASSLCQMFLVLSDNRIKKMDTRQVQTLYRKEQSSDKIS
jgi:hypothetical protein